jgi:CubicO group peptidase (beta-lactamase class C family)
MQRREFLAMAAVGVTAGLAREAQAAVWPVPDWQTSAPDNIGLTPAGLEAVKAFLQERGTRAALVIRGGRIGGEWFWEDSTAATQFPVYSITKSFSATAVGFLESEGKLKLDTPASNFIPEWKSDERAAVTVKHLLSMTSGMSKDETGLREAQDRIGFALTQKLQAPAGTKWDYNNVGCSALSEVVAKAAGEQLSAYLRRKLYEPTGIKAYRHEEPAGRTLPYSGLHINARDLARFGYLYLHQGSWSDRSLLPAGFVAAATSASQDLNKGYGYLFWVNTAGQWADVPKDAYAARGAFGNELLVIPSKDLIVVRLLGTKQNSGVDMNKLGSLAYAACS